MLVRPLLLAISPASRTATVASAFEGRYCITYGISVSSITRSAPSAPQSHPRLARDELDKGIDPGSAWLSLCCRVRTWPPLRTYFITSKTWGFWCKGSIARNKVPVTAFREVDDAIGEKPYRFTEYDWAKIEIGLKAHTYATSVGCNPGLS
jgi:hypothetical protein